MASSVEIRGLAELHKTLQELPAKIERNVLRGGLRAGAKVMEAAAKERVPVKHGDLRASIRVSMRTSSKAGTVRAQVKAGNKKAWYAHLVEFGTARHWIKPKNRKSLFIAGLMKEVVDHPGAKQKPFMRPAFDGKWRAAIDAMAAYIRARLPKEIGKQNK